MSSFIAWLFGTGSGAPKSTAENVCCFPDQHSGFLGEFGTTKFPRSGFGESVGATAYGWPMKGGYYTLDCSVVELDFLGLDRFEPSNRSQSQEEEEIHCAKLRQLGATWFSSDSDEFYSAHKCEGWDSPRLYFGWPAEGGVWAMSTTRDGAGSSGMGRIGNAFTMDERCEMIKRLGGTFYADPKNCPHLDLDGVDDERKHVERVGPRA